MSEQSTGVIGGGIVGLAVARELVRRRPGERVVVFEKEDRLASHQTGHSSGVVHAGIYYQPGSLKARLCSRGRELLRDYCAEHEIAYDECGKLVVAVDRSELARLDALEDTARRNGVPGLRRIDAEGICEIEPHAVGLAALHSPRTAITDFVAVAEAMGREVRASGGEILLGARVTGLERRGGRIEVVCGETGQGGEGHGVGSRVVDRLVICAGLQADRVARLADDTGGPRIIPFRGEFLRVLPGKQALVRGLVYPVPDPRYPFLGVHFTHRVSGGLDVGPNAVLGLDREGYRRFGLEPADLRDIVGWPGFWRLARAHWRTGASEVLGSLSVRATMRSAQRYVPEIGPADVVRGDVGVRAQAVERDGSLVDDFRISHNDGVTSVRNAPSPAATSSLAIAEHLVEELDHND